MVRIQSNRTVRKKRWELSGSKKKMGGEPKNPSAKFLSTKKEKEKDKEKIEHQTMTEETIV